MKIALLQQKYDKKNMIKNTTNKIKKAAKKGAKLVILQELHEGAYFCIDEKEESFSLADNFQKSVKYWSKVAKKKSVVLVTSLFEKRACGLNHNTSVVFEKDGSIAGKYRKMHIPHDPSFYEKYYFTPGDLGFEPIKTSVGNLGVLVCWDQWFPEAARIMALKGADILIYPTAIGWFDSDNKKEQNRQLQAWLTMQKSHAVANGLTVVGVNRVGKEKSQDKNEDIRFWGNSFVSDSFGELIYQAPNDKEALGIVEVDLAKSKEIRKIWPFLRDRRIDAYGGLNSRFLD